LFSSKQENLSPHHARENQIHLRNRIGARAKQSVSEGWDGNQRAADHAMNTRLRRVLTRVDAGVEVAVMMATRV